MTTLTIEVPDELAARLEAAAARSNVPADELARSILSGALPSRPMEIRDGKRVLPEIIPGDSGDPTLATRIDEILREEWANAIERDH